MLLFFILLIAFSSIRTRSSVQIHIIEAASKVSVICEGQMSVFIDFGRHCLRQKLTFSEMTMCFLISAEAAIKCAACYLKTNFNKLHFFPVSAENETYWINGDGIRREINRIDCITSLPWIFSFPFGKVTLLVQLFYHSIFLFPLWIKIKWQRMKTCLVSWCQ